MALALSVVVAPPVVRAQASGVAAYEAHVRSGTEHFQAGDFPTARAEFQAAYDIHPEPTLLFNIASTHRREGNARAAVDSYRRFLAEAPTDHPNRQLAQNTIAELEAELESAGFEDGFLDESELGDEEGEAGAGLDAAAEAEAAAADLEPASDASVLQAPSAPRDDEPEPGRHLRIAGAVTISAGAVGLIAAAVDLRRAAEFSAQLESAPQGAWTAELQEYYDSGQRAEDRAIVFGSLGLVAVATGAVLYWLGERETDTAGVDVAVSAGAGSAHVGLSGRF